LCLKVSAVGNRWRIRPDIGCINKEIGYPIPVIEFVRRAEEYAVFGAEVVVEMGSETYGKRPAARAWAITRRAQRASHRASDRHNRGERREADRASRTDRTSRARAQVQEREVTADAR
jgi:hypothetical protein